MRITFVLPVADMAGGVRVVAIYAQELGRRGHQVRVVSVPPPRPTFRQVARGLIHSGQWRSAHSRSGTARSHLDSVAVEHRILERHRRVVASDLPDADVVVATWWETAEWVAAFPAAKGAKVHFVQHYETWGGEPQRVDAALRLPSHKIVVAQWLAELVEEKSGGQPVTLVPNGVDVELFNAPRRGKQVQPTVGLMYSRIPFKGTSRALAAVELARQQLPALRLVAFGNEPPGGWLTLPSNSRFVHLPRQQDIAGLYGQCDAWIVASSREGFGLPILEAMACRTPVIATPAGAAPQLLGEGGGILLDSLRPEAMAAAILAIHAMDERAWQVLSDQAFAIAAGHTWQRSVEGFEAALRAAAQPAGRLGRGAPMHLASAPWKEARF